MYIAMNRFQVLPAQADAFEQVWRSRDSHLSEVPGFVDFRLLRGAEAEDHILYASHTVWATEQAFTAWTKSEAFRKAHASAGAGPKLTIGHPQFEGFATVLED